MKQVLQNTLTAVVLVLLGVTTALAQQHGLKAEYYDGVNFDKLVAVKFVDNIDNDWYDTPPVAGIDPHQCSIRWHGKIITAKSGSYDFSARVDDGIRVWIDDRLIIDQWALNDVGVFENSVYLAAYQVYTLKVEYFNALLEGEVRLLWKVPEEEKEQSWFEYFFGEDDPYSVIAPWYFFRPDEVEAVVDNTPPNAPAENTSLSEPVTVTPVDNGSPSPQTSQEVFSNPKPITSVEAEKYIPKNIGFERAKTTILESSIDELDVFAAFMLAHPELSVKIEGHTDPVGDEAANLKLSKNRAYKIANYLANKGIDRKRLSAEGFGGSRPLKMPKNGEYYPANRRVVFILSGFE